MFCPRCRTEYRPGFVTCSDCNAALVDHLSDTEEKEASSEYVVVATVQSRIEERQIRSFLEANGIPSEVGGESVREVYGLTLNGLGAAKILVPKPFAKTAQELLERADDGELRLDETDWSRNNVEDTE